MRNLIHCIGMRSDFHIGIIHELSSLQAKLDNGLKTPTTPARAAPEAQCPCSWRGADEPLAPVPVQTMID